MERANVLSLLSLGLIILIMKTAKIHDLDVVGRLRIAYSHRPWHRPHSHCRRFQVHVFSDRLFDV